MRGTPDRPHRHSHNRTHWSMYVCFQSNFISALSCVPFAPATPALHMPSFHGLPCRLHPRPVIRATTSTQLHILPLRYASLLQSGRGYSLTRAHAQILRSHPVTSRLDRGSPGLTLPYSQQPPSTTQRSSARTCIQSRILLPLLH